MSEESKESTFRSVELDWKSWSDLLFNFKCLECSKTLQRLPHPDYTHLPPEEAEKFGKIGCGGCFIYYEPPQETKEEKEEARQPSLREKEKTTERSGGSLYPPIPIHYFCEICYKQARLKLLNKNKIEVENDLPVSVPSGYEGLVAIPVQQQMILKDHITTLPFTCSCGTRRFIEITMHDSIGDYLLFEVPLGFHDKCFNCRHVFDKRVGEDVFRFRCDFNTKCPDIKEIREKGLLKLADEDE